MLSILAVGDGDKRITVWGHPRPKEVSTKQKKVSTKNKLDMVIHTCDPSYAGSRVRIIVRESAAGPGQKHETLWGKKKT
jgi:hypothetical protein